MRFEGILRGRQADRPDAWIENAINTNLALIMRFALTLHPNIDAFRNAIELPRSNIQAKGQINRLKTLKRVVYGRVGPNLLRVRKLPLRHTD